MDPMCAQNPWAIKEYTVVYNSNYIRIKTYSGSFLMSYLVDPLPWYHIKLTKIMFDGSQHSFCERFTSLLFSSLKPRLKVRVTKTLLITRESLLRTVFRAQTFRCQDKTSQGLCFTLCNNATFRDFVLPNSLGFPLFKSKRYSHILVQTNPVVLLSLDDTTAQSYYHCSGQALRNVSAGLHTEATSSVLQSF